MAEGIDNGPSPVAVKPSGRHINHTVDFGAADSGKRFDRDGKSGGSKAAFARCGTNNGGDIGVVVVWAHAVQRAGALDALGALAAD